METVLNEKPGVRELRGNLSAYLNAAKPAVVRVHRRPVALVVPVPRHNWYNSDEVRKACVETKRRLTAALDLAFTKQDLA